MPDIERTIYLTIRHYHTLGITLEELEVLLYILIQQHEYPEKRLYIHTIATDIGKTERAIQKHLAHLRAKHALITTQRFNADGGRTASAFDCSPLITMLEAVHD